MTIYEIIKEAENHAKRRLAEPTNSNPKREWVDTAEIDIIDFIAELIAENNIEVTDVFSQDEIDVAATEKE